MVGSSLFSVEWVFSRPQYSRLKAGDVKAWGGASRRAQPQDQECRKLHALKGRDYPGVCG